MGYYSVLKSNKILLQAPWINVEDTTLSEIIKAQMDKHCTIPLT